MLACDGLFGSQRIVAVSVLASEQNGVPRRKDFGRSDKRSPASALIEGCFLSRVDRPGDRWIFSYDFGK